MPNRLATSKSPYLQQHAENPVDWYPWGDEAFERAQAEDKPVLVSIGYSACHWCHVMAHESFENPTVARLMNEQFVNIKVDREERPDVDAVYMGAVQMMAGQAGWPLNVFLTPDRRPFFGGTYWPPAQRHGMAAWPQILHSIILAWRNERQKLEESGTSLIDHMSQAAALPQSDVPLKASILDDAFQIAKQYFDQENGGFGDSPKFPQPMNIELLLRNHVRTGNQEALSMACLTLDRMAAGGIHDQLGGGFHRYTVDGSWTVPHFEKMLYDNAQLGRLYTEAWQATKSEAYRRTAEAIFDYVLRDMTAPEGGFYSSEDADSEGVEGKFYLWDREEIARELDTEEADIFSRRYGVTTQGNFDGKTILTISATIDAVARDVGFDESRVAQYLDSAKKKLVAVRNSRKRPSLDCKILTDWNALMLRSLTLAGRAFERQDYLDAATANARFLTDSMWSGDMLIHVYNDGPGDIPGYIDDYAFLMEALETLFEATGEISWLETSQAIAHRMIELFMDEIGGFFTTPSDAEGELPVQLKNITDSVIPSGNSSAAMGLLRLSALTGDHGFDSPAVATMRVVAPALETHGLSFGYMLAALDYYLARKQEIIIIKPAGRDEGANEMRGLIYSEYMPHAIRVSVDSTAAAESSNPLLQGRYLVNNLAAAYVCEDYVCALPVTDPGALLARLERSSPG